MTQHVLPHAHDERFDSAEMKQAAGRVADFQIVADIHKLLADTSRLRIFWILCHCEECVVNISALVDMTMPAVSHHLKQLKAGGLVESRRDGREVYYRATRTERCRALHESIERMMEIACPPGTDRSEGQR